MKNALDNVILKSFFSIFLLQLPLLHQYSVLTWTFQSWVGRLGWPIKNSHKAMKSSAMPCLPLCRETWKPHLKGWLRKRGHMRDPFQCKMWNTAKDVERVQNCQQVERVTKCSRNTTLTGRALWKITPGNSQVLQSWTRMCFGKWEINQLCSTVR